MSVNKYCFAYYEKDKRPKCNALNEIDCTNCKFYKKRAQIKDNPFYEFSFKTKEEYEKAKEWIKK